MRLVGESAMTSRNDATSVRHDARSDKWVERGGCEQYNAAFMRPQRFICVLAWCALALPSVAAAAPGDITASFGDGDGLARIPTSRASIARGAGDTIYVLNRRSGSSADGVVRTRLTRFTSDGLRDSTFGSGGTVLLDLGSTSIEARAQIAAVDEAGNIVIAGLRPAAKPSGSCDDGVTYRTPFVLRVTSAGVPDSSFGTGGLVELSPPAGADPPSCAGVSSLRLTLLPEELGQQGMVVGMTSVDPEGSDVHLQQLFSTGGVNSSWANGGIAHIGGLDGEIIELRAIGTSVRFVVRGESGAWIGALDATGTPASEFGDGAGFALVSGVLGASMPAVITSTGAVIATSHIRGASGEFHPVVLARTDAFGQSDAAYPATGDSVVFHSADGGRIAGATELDDGRLMLAGYQSSIGDPAWRAIGAGLRPWVFQTITVAREDGSADTRYGAGGRMTIPASRAFGAIMLSDGSFVQLVDVEGAGSGIVRVCGITACEHGVSPSRVRRGSAAADVIAGLYVRETIHAGGGADTVHGGLGNDQIHGDRGNDVLSGDGGDDVLDGDAGADVIRGGSGRDVLIGRRGADRLVGGASVDVLRGGSGVDRVDGGAGSDRIYVRDGERDLVECGAGHDVVIADRVDHISGNCERVRYRAGGTS